MGAIVSPLLGVGRLPPAPPPVVVEPAVDPAVAARDASAAARRAFLARRRTGRQGTIATTARGILSPGAIAVARRSLLGGSLARLLCLSHATARSRCSIGRWCSSRRSFVRLDRRRCSGSIGCQPFVRADAVG